MAPKIGQWFFFVNPRLSELRQVWSEWGDFNRFYIKKYRRYRDIFI